MKHKVTEAETMVPDILDLQAFCLVVDQRSLTGAAKIMRESKANVSRRLTRLENSLGVSLLQRSPKLVEPTEDGVAYRIRVGEILELLGDANTAVRHAKEAPNGTLRITATPEFGGLFARLLTNFTQQFPEVMIEMVLSNSVLDLDAERIDVAFRVASKLPDSSLIAHKLTELNAIFVASPSYLKNKPAPKKPEELSQHRLVALNSWTNRVLTVQNEKTEETSEIRLKPSISSSDMNFAKEVVLSGGGIAALPSAALSQELADGRLVRILPRFHMTGAALYLMYRGKRFLPPKVRAFRDFVLRVVPSGC